jgi:hypothetical protein
MAHTAAWVKTHWGTPPKGWWRWNIRNPYSYAKSMRRQVGRKALTPKRLKVAIEEDSGQTVSLKECGDILHVIDKFGRYTKR